MIKSNIEKHLGEGSGCVIHSVVSYTINVSKYNLLVGSRYIKLPKELDHPRKGLINIQNINNNECFKWCLIWSLHPTDHNTRKISWQKLTKYIETN